MAIAYRTHSARQERLRALSWQTRNIVKWVALGIQVQTDKPADGEQLLSELAEQSVWVDEEEREDLLYAAEVARRRQPAPEPRTGSTEALLAAFGGAMKR